MLETEEGELFKVKNLEACSLRERIVIFGFLGLFAVLLALVEQRCISNVVVSLYVM